MTYLRLFAEFIVIVGAFAFMLAVAGTFRLPVGAYSIAAATYVLYIVVAHFVLYDLVYGAAAQNTDTKRAESIKKHRGKTIVFGLSLVLIVFMLEAPTLRPRS